MDNFQVECCGNDPCFISSDFNNNFCYVCTFGDQENASIGVYNINNDTNNM